MLSGKDKLYAYTVEEASRRCDVTVKTMYAWINKKIVEAINIDGVLKLKTSDVDYLAGIKTVRAAAKYFDVDYVFLMEWLNKKEKVIHSPLVNLKNKYYVNWEWLVENQEEMRKNYDIRRSSNIKSKRVRSGKRLILYRDQMRLFDVIELNGKTFRYISLDYPVKLLNISTGEISPVDIDTGQSLPCKDDPYVGYAGKVDFLFYKRDLLKEIHALDYLVSNLGTKNIMVFEHEDYYQVTCRNNLLSYDQEVYKVLKSNVHKGDIWDDRNGNIVLGDYEVRVYVPIKYRLVLEIQNKLNDGQSIGDWINQQINQHILIEKVDKHD